jgi:uncharacterized protein (DUF697 family)
MKTVFADLGQGIDGRGIGGSGLLPLLLLCNNRELLPIQALVLASAPEHLTADARFQQAPERPADHPDLLAAGIDAMAALLPQRRRRDAASYAGLVVAMATRSGVVPADLAATERALLTHHHVDATRDLPRALIDLPAGWESAERRALECVLRLALLRRAKRRALEALGPAPAAATGTAARGPDAGAPEPGPAEREAPPEPQPDGAVRVPWTAWRLGDLRRFAASSLEYLPDFGAIAASLFPPCTILLAGRRGAGRATLAQALTGAAQPADRSLPLMTLATQSSALRLVALDLDSPDAITQLDDAIARRGHKPDAAWLCIDEQNPTIDDAERALVRALAAAAVPVLIAVTKGWSARAITPTVERIFPDAQVVHRVVAVPRFDEAGRLTAATGLEKLVRDTLHRLPARKRHGFAAAQQVLWEPRLAAARAVMRRAVTAASAAAATPIPFAHAVALVPIQVAMLAGISRALGLALDQAAVQAVAAAALGCTASTLGGRALAAGLLKLVPGVGSVVGGVINSAVAASVTRMLGEAYLEFVSMTMGRKGRLPDPAEIIAHLKAGWRRPAA